MEVTRELAEKVKGLGALAEFPTDREAVAVIAEHIADLCSSQWQVDELIREMRRFDKWPGPATLKNVFDELYPPSSRESRAEWLDDRPEPIECQDCLDLGVLDWFTNPRPCTCPEGQRRGAAEVRGILKRKTEGLELRRRARETSDRLNPKKPAGGK